MAPQRKVEILDIELIEVHGRMRQVRDDTVAQLAASMERLGLRTPISVRYHPERPASLPAGETDDALVLMTGAHRIAAAKLLGWEKIECFVYYDGDEIDAQLWEIAENLHRAELTALERDEQVALWVKLNAQKVSQPATPGGQQPKFKGIRAAERELGVKRDDASRAVKVAGLTDEAKQAARDAGLDDNRTALLDAAKHDSVADQVAAIRARAELQHRPKIADRPLHDIEALERQVAALMSAWNKASAEARQEFLARIETPVFDRSAA